MQKKNPENRLVVKIAAFLFAQPLTMAEDMKNLDLLLFKKGGVTFGAKVFLIPPKKSSHVLTSRGRISGFSIKTNWKLENLAILCARFGMVKWPFQTLSHLN